MFALTMSVHKVYLWLPARVVKYKITGQREPELHCSSINLISEALFCLEGEEKNLTSSLVWADNTESCEDF